MHYCPGVASNGPRSAISGSALASAHEPLVLLRTLEGGFAGELPDAGRHRRVHVDEPGDLRELELFADGERELLQHLPRGRGEDVRAHDLALRPGHDDDRALSGAVGPSAVVVHE